MRTYAREPGLHTRLPCGAVRAAEEGVIILMMFRALVVRLGFGRVGVGASHARRLRSGLRAGLRRGDGIGLRLALRVGLRVHSLGQAHAETWLLVRTRAEVLRP